jgi:hypothetical protein
MKLNIEGVEGVEFEIETKLPPRYENAVSVQMVLEDWYKLVRDAERKEKRDLRLKKINEINEISQKGK